MRKLTWLSNVSFQWRKGGRPQRPLVKRSRLGGSVVEVCSRRERTRSADTVALLSVGLVPGGRNRATVHFLKRIPMRPGRPGLRWSWTRSRNPLATTAGNESQTESSVCLRWFRWRPLCIGWCGIQSGRCCRGSSRSKTAFGAGAKSPWDQHDSSCWPAPKSVSRAASSASCLG